MPITLTVTRGVLAEKLIPEAVAGITQAFLAVHGLEGNVLMTRNVTTHVNIVEREASFAGGKPVEGAWVEIKVPSFALATHELQKRFFAEATSILVRLSEGRLVRERVWSNVIHTVDGSWNTNGTAMTNAELGQALQDYAA